VASQHGCREDFFSGGASVDFFQVVTKSILSGGNHMVKFHFTKLKITETHFLQKRIEKNQIQNVEGNALLHSPYDAGGSESYAQWR